MSLENLSEEKEEQVTSIKEEDDHFNQVSVADILSLINP